VHAEVVQTFCLQCMLVACLGPGFPGIQNPDPVNDSADENTPNERPTAGKQTLFPPTDWSLIGAARDANEQRRLEAARYFAEKYWRPVYCYVRSFGRDHAEAEDITQEFSAFFLEKDALAKADASKGRFRTFLLSALDNFLHNRNRYQTAQKRSPGSKILPIQGGSSGTAEYFEPREHETPKAAFDRAWTAELVLRVLDALQVECAEGAKQTHFEIFRLFIVQPAFDGVEPPSYAELAERFHLEPEQVGFRILTARRAYQRLLRAEIATFACSEAETEAEIDALMGFLSKS